MIVPALKWLEDHPAIDGAIVAGLVGIAVTYFIMKPPPPKPEPYAPEIKQKDGSTVLERTPVTEKDLPPAPELPQGTHRSRQVGVVIRPTAAPSVPLGAPPGTKPTCPDVRVDLTFAKAKDGTTRVVAKSPDGEIVGGRDLPVDLVAQPYSRAHGAGLIYSTHYRGLTYEQDFARLRVGVDVFQPRVNNSFQGLGVGGRLIFTW